MSGLKFLLIWIHQACGWHDFKLVPVRGGCKARCSCGLYIEKAR